VKVPLLAPACSSAAAPTPARPTTRHWTVLPRATALTLVRWIHPRWTSPSVTSLRGGVDGCLGGAVPSGGGYLLWSVAAVLAAATWALVTGVRLPASQQDDGLRGLLVRSRAGPPRRSDGGHEVWCVIRVQGGGTARSVAGVLTGSRSPCGTRRSAAKSSLVSCSWPGSENVRAPLVRGVSRTGRRACRPAGPPHPTPGETRRTGLPEGVPEQSLSRAPQCRRRPAPVPARRGDPR
jgi:hypothetical protein